MGFRLPISFKLIFLTMVLLLAVAIPVSFQSAELFEEITVRREIQANLEQSNARAIEIEQLFTGYIDKIKIVAALMTKDYATDEAREKDLDLTFHQDRDLVSVEIKKLSSSEPPRRVVNTEFLKAYNLTPAFIDQVRSVHSERDSFKESTVFEGEIEIRSSMFEGGAPLMTIGIPLVRDQFGRITQIALAEVKLERLQKMFSKASERIAFLIDNTGRIMAHPDENKIVKGESALSSPFVKSALASTVRSQQKIYEEPGTKRRLISAFTKTPLGLSVIVEAPEEVILEGAKRVRREALLIAGRVLSIAIFLMFIFSITLTSPIERLAEMTREVARGNFDVDAKIRSKDEVGDLASSFNSMISGLKERDKIRNVLNKFHGSAVADDLLKGNLELGGSSKTVTVFFSDIRDFTKFSEGHSPEEVVGMLNEYFQVMVSIVEKSGGVVDKFIGDAIMAVWGVPNGSDKDSHNAVMACLEMRKSLEELNRVRIGRNQVPIKIGMGLHSGVAISGKIGSEQRMEFTVIGDSVNQASRIEAATKAFGTDFLISQSVFDAVQSEFVIEKAGDVEVKGKSAPLSLFRVRGYMKDNQPVLIRTPYSDFEAGEADKVKIA